MIYIAGDSGQILCGGKPLSDKTRELLLFSYDPQKCIVFMVIASR